MTEKLSASSPALNGSVPQVNNVFLTLLPLVAAVFIGFLIIGMQLPVLPLHLHGTLGMSTLVVGLVIGSQFVAALLSRSWAGNFADIHGAKRAMAIGLLVTAASGVLYLLSLLFIHAPVTSVWILLAGRIVLALGESLLVTGAMGWGIGLVGARHAGKVMSWNGIAMYGAYALGAPLGVAFNVWGGFFGLSLAVLLVPFIALLIIAKVRGVAPVSAAKTSIFTVLNAVWQPGLGLALCSVGFGVIEAFIALLFTARHWGNASLAFTAFGLAFIMARIFFGHLPDKLGGARVALVCVMIEALGQLFIWRADTLSLALLGAALTGFGYSLAFPGFGVEAVRRAPPQTRSLAMGAYVAFLDVSLAITAPLAGALAGKWGIGSVYLAGAIAVSLSVIMALILLAGRGNRESLPG
ncbi:putative MFS family arabinose efflux permease [Raoultella sp. BIGb0138]|uniref:arabinose transporter n=1 Tax=Raoultella sp. BIGb0138 TaxID=2485115 RepID=UPI001046BAEA|nr:arabinose transporter [Raoultella sp. BIGb0138]TCW06425.1 putative MFS family arabinose efflux permease [Raoultella sp. BIGb0138]